MIEYNCGNCGAILKVNADDDVVVCDFCGSTIELERSSEDVMKKRAHALAEKIREYDKINRNIQDAKSEVSRLTSEYINVQAQRKKIAPDIYMKAVGIWILALSVCWFIVSSLDVFGIILEVLAAIAGGYFAYITAKKKVDESLHANTVREQYLFKQKEEANKKSEELSAEFDEDFIPVQVRNAKAIQFIINALETERAYTLPQAIGLWEDKSEYQNKFDELNRKIAASQVESDSSKDHDSLDTLTGAALGAVGSVVAKKAVKEIFKRL